jgi:flagellar motor switch/type III secretory pathway protein FliN
MWQVLAVAAAGALLVACSERESAHSEVVHRQRRVKEKTDDYQRRLKRLAENEKAHSQFVEMTSLHHQSHLHGLQIRQEVQQLRESLQEDKQARHKLKQLIDQAFQQKRASDSRTEKHALQGKIEQLLTIKRQVQVRINENYEILNIFQQQLQQHDRQTRALKLQIRDQCGTRGKQWYARLVHKPAA